MSVIKTAIRICTVEALKNRTLFAEHVLDSQNDALTVSDGDEIGSSRVKPFIAVYTEGSENESPSFPMGLHADGTVELTIELGIAHTQLEEDEDGNKFVAADLPATDANMEYRLDIAVRQIKDALLDPDNDWSDILRSMTLGLNKVSTQRAGQGNSFRMAARQIKMSFSVIDDPEFGAVPSPDLPLGRFLAKLEAHDDQQYRAIGDELREVIAGTEMGHAAQTLLGLSNKANEVLNQPAGDVEIPSDAAAVSEISIDDGTSETTETF